MYQKYKQNILRIYDRAIALSTTLKEPNIRQRLEEQQKHLCDGKLFVVVCGEFKQGKSQLINALLNEENLFPVDVDITTNLISTISYAPQEKISVVLNDTRKEKFIEISRNQIPDYVTEQKNQRNQKQAKMLVIEASNPQLQEGLVLVDTPGTGSLNTEHTAISYAFIPYADAIIFVSDVQAPLTTNELNFIKDRIFTHCQKLIFVVTKIDAVTNYQKIVESNRKKLAETLEKSLEEIVIIPVSSKNKLDYCQTQDEEDLEDSNFQELENTIWKLVSEERGQILLMNALTELQQATSEMKAPVKAEWEAYKEESQQELDRLEKDIEEAQQQREKFLEEKAEWQTQLYDGIEDIKIQLEQAFENQFAKIQHQSSAYLDDSRLIDNPKEIANLIEADIDGIMVELSKDLNQLGSELYRHLEQLTELNFNPLMQKKFNRQRAKVSQEKIETDQVFEECLKLTADHPSLTSFHQLLAKSYEQLHQPMRVAIVGLIKAGKSTLMNALLQENVVATGTVEATFNVNWLKYGKTRQIWIYFNNSRPPEAKSFEELTELTLRPEDHQDYLLSIKYIEVSYPNEILKTFNLIDTPGFQSFYQDDSQKTRDFLQLHGETLSQVTESEAANADAVLYLFSHSLGEQDKQIVEQFQGLGMGQASPLNAIGVLTKIDFYASDPNVSDPLTVGDQISKRLREHPNIQPLLYTIKPISGLLAFGAKTLTDSEINSLQELAALPEERFAKLIRSADRFCNRNYEDIPTSPEKRTELWKRLDRYGVELAYSFQRSGVSDKEQLVQHLLEKSGLPALRDLIVSHFGHRAFLIKLSRVLQNLNAAYYQQRNQLHGEALPILEQVTGKLESLQSGEHTFQELEVLRCYYDGKLDFDEQEIQQLLEVTGEYGSSCGERLGLGERATVDEMIPVAQERMAYWQERANDSFFSDRATIAAARVLNLSYQRILDRVQKAKSLLYI